MYCYVSYCHNYSQFAACMMYRSADQSQRVSRWKVVSYAGDKERKLKSVSELCEI